MHVILFGGEWPERAEREIRPNPKEAVCINHRNPKMVFFNPKRGINNMQLERLSVHVSNSMNILDHKLKQGKIVWRKDQGKQRRPIQEIYGQICGLKVVSLGSQSPLFMTHLYYKVSDYFVRTFC